MTTFPNIIKAGEVSKCQSVMINSQQTVERAGRAAQTTTWWRAGPVGLVCRQSTGSLWSSWAQKEREQTWACLTFIPFVFFCLLLSQHFELVSRKLSETANSSKIFKTRICLPPTDGFFFSVQLEISSLKTLVCHVCNMLRVTGGRVVSL